MKYLENNDSTIEQMNEKTSILCFCNFYLCAISRIRSFIISVQSSFNRSFFKNDMAQALARCLVIILQLSFVK